MVKKRFLIRHLAQLVLLFAPRSRPLPNGTT